MKKVIFIYSIACILCLTSCLEELPYETSIQSQSLVIDGGVNNLKENQSIRISQTLAYGVPPSPVSGAEVKVIEDNKKEYHFTGGLNGTYWLAANDYEPRINSTYSLRIVLNGQTYQSDPEVMLPPIQPDSLSWNIDQETMITSSGIPRTVDGIRLRVHTPLGDGNKKLFLKWEVQSAFQFSTMPQCNPFRTVYTCYFGKTLQPSKLLIYSNVDNGLRYLKGEELAFEDLDFPYQFVETHYYSLIQHRISEQAFEYYRKLRLIAQQNGTIFDPIPAFVKSNVYNVSDKNQSISGFFLVSSDAIIRTRVVHADFSGLIELPSKEYNYCGWIIGLATPYYAPCCDCNELSETQIQKPDWW